MTQPITSPDTTSLHPLPPAELAALREAADQLINVQRVRYDRLWSYYRNPMRIGDIIDPSTSARPYRQAQEWGLPSRITGGISGQGVFDSTGVDGVARKEVVIENDIGWRIETQVDFLFGRPIVLNSAAPDPQRAALLESLLRDIFAANGGLIFLQKLALLGAVYGGVDVLVKFIPEPADAADDSTDPACATQLLGDNAPPPAVASPAALKINSETTIQSGPPPAEPATRDASPAASPGNDSTTPAATNPSHPTLQRLARMVKFEIVEPARALPRLMPSDCRCVQAFGTVYQLDRTPADPPVKPRPRRWWLSRQSFDTSLNTPLDSKRRTIVELITPTLWQKYDDFELVDEMPSTLGRLPLVHIQNVADPLAYEGASDVEPLIPLQDELNTRLSDRAYRIAMTSFRMYLGKGIENFTELPVAPGRMWSTDNLQADVIEFGGDSASPSEESHISDVRDALDKTSGVSPVAAGTVKGRIGNLTSAAALKVTMMALLARTERRRVTYGVAITQLCELALAWLDHAGLLATTADDRQVQIHWPSPVPSDESDRLSEAAAKEKVGVPRDTVLRELGYPTEPEAVVTS